MIVDGLHEEFLKLHLLDIFFGPNDVPLGKGTRKQDSNILCVLRFELIGAVGNVGIFWGVHGYGS